MFAKYSKLLIILLAVGFLAVAGGAQQSPRVITASGTGFVVGADGYILTNAHVIREATSVSIQIAGASYSATIVESRPDQDLALLKISRSGLPVVAFGNSDTVQIGDQVVAIGCPEGFCGTVTVGRVANLGQTATFTGGVTLHNLIMIDVTIAPGSSGGPLLNMKGEVIGITMGGIEGTRFGFAIPINDAIPLLQRVPDFDRSQMGQATQELALSEIVERLGRTVSYIETRREIPLQRLLLPEQEFSRITRGFTYEDSCIPAWGPWSPIYPTLEDSLNAGDVELFLEYCSGIWDLISANAAKESQDQAHAKLRANFVADPISQGFSLDRYYCEMATTSFCFILSLNSQAARSGNVQIRFSSIVGNFWDCSRYCTLTSVFPLELSCDFGRCIQEKCQTSPPDKVFAGAVVASWLIEDMMFYTTFKANGFVTWWWAGWGISYNDVAEVMTALAQAAIAHALRVLQNP